MRLELNKELPTDNQMENCYTRAARLLRDWQTDGALTQDSARSLYVYHKEFEVEGQEHTRKGFFARLRLEPFGHGKIFPHGETMSGPKADRLRLLQPTAMNSGPVFSLYP